MNFFYRILVGALQPTSWCLLLLLAASVFSKRKMVGRVCFWMAVAVLLVCGNAWVVGGFAWKLERRYLTPDPVPKADCILVLGGGTLSRVPPRPTIEINEAGNRILYAANLYRQGKASRIPCTGAAANDSIGTPSEAADMAGLLEIFGVGKEAILTETKARNTHEHATNVYPLLKDRGFKRVLLVTSAMHMPRSVGVLRRLCPGIEFVPVPTDFRSAGWNPAPWRQPCGALIPTAQNLLNWSRVMHEYVGISYYKVRGWM